MSNEKQKMQRFTRIIMSWSDSAFRNPRCGLLVAVMTARGLLTVFFVCGNVSRTFHAHADRYPNDTRTCMCVAYRVDRW
jgi:hypothetical protein